MGRAFTAVVSRTCLGLLCAVLGCATTESQTRVSTSIATNHTHRQEIAPRVAKDADIQRIASIEGVAQLLDPVSQAGQLARGIYLTGPYMRRITDASSVLQLLERTGSNAVVLDMKDDQGRVFFDSELAALQGQKSRPFRRMPELVRSLKEAGIYTIGRIVCFSDPVLPRREPLRAVKDNRPHKRGAPWVSWGNGSTWLDPYNSENHALIVTMASEVAALGVDEIQLDYIRFPVDPGTRFADFPGQTDRPRRFVLRDLLRQVDEAIDIPLSVDVFGLAAFREGDPTGLGQSLEDWTPYIEIFSPMLYINNMKSWGRGVSEGRAYTLVNAGIRRLRQRLGPGSVIRPFLQAFSAGADYFNANFISEQIAAARTGGADGYLFWHPASNYATIARAMQRKSTRAPFAVAQRQQWRQRHWSSATGKE